MNRRKFAFSSLVFFVALFVAGVAQATDTRVADSEKIWPDQGSASSACQAGLSYEQNVLKVGIDNACNLVGTASSQGAWNAAAGCYVEGGYYYKLYGHDYTGPYDYKWCYGHNLNPCASQLHASTNMWSGKHFNGDSFGVNVTDPISKGSVQCTMVFSAMGVPTLDQNGWETFGTATPTGDIGTGMGGWQPDGGDAPSNPQPPNLSQPPKICGGASCYDPASDSYCATSGGQQYCVSGSSGRTTGACSGAVCAGVGDAGSGNVPLPDSNSIPDPSSELNGEDGYVQGDPGTRGSQTITVVTYNLPGAGNTSSGGTSGDLSTGGTSTGGTSQPSSGSSTGGCTAGPICGDQYLGAPCGADPITQGDPLLGATVVELHKIRCNDQPISATDLQSATAGKYDWDQTASPDQVFKDGDTSADTGFSGVDDTGFLGGSGVCPGFQPVMLNGVNMLDSTGICNTAGMLRGFVLAMAYAFAAIIIYRGKAGG